MVGVGSPPFPLPPFLCTSIATSLYLLTLHINSLDTSFQSSEQLSTSLVRPFPPVCFSPNRPYATFFFADTESFPTPLPLNSENEPKVHPRLLELDTVVRPPFFLSLSTRLLEKASSSSDSRSYILHSFSLAISCQTLSPHNAVLNETVHEAQEQEQIGNLEAYLRKGIPNTPVNI
jgi:hypothetical protein